MSFRCSSFFLPLIAAVALVGCRAGADADEGPGMTVTVESPEETDGATMEPVDANIRQLTFENQDALSMRLADLEGKPALVTFVYTRCPIPNMCPATTMNVANVQDALTPEERQRVKLVTVSFDPEYDTAAVLKQYGEAYGADFDCWEFWRGSEEDTEKLMDSVGAWAQQTGAEYAHNMRGVILAPDGSVADLLRGSSWDPVAAAAALRRLMSDEPST